MPTSVKVKLRRQPNKSGEKGIVIQVIHNRKSTELSINEYVLENLFDHVNSEVRAKHPRSAKINKTISDELKKVKDIVFEFRQAGKPFELTDITQCYKNNIDPETTSNPYLRDYLSSLMNSNPEGLSFSTLKYYKTSYNKWTEYMPKIKLTNLSEAHLLKFKSKLEEEGLKPSSVYKNMKVIKKIVRWAMKNGLVDRNPFINIKFHRPKSQRQYLNMDELKALTNVETQTNSDMLAKDVFLFSAYTGLRFGDMCTLTRKNIEQKDNRTRLKITIQKTKEPLEFNLNKRAVEILNKYITSKSDGNIFPMLNKLVVDSKIEIRKKIESKNAYLNKKLKSLALKAGITKNISMHIGRHTFAVLSIEMGGDLYVLSKMLGHTSIVTTEIYAKMVDKRKDELVEIWNNV